MLYIMERGYDFERCRGESSSSDEVGNSKLTVLGSGLWSNGISSHGIHTLHLWVDIGERVADTDTVGIRITADNWETFEEHFGSRDSTPIESSANQLHGDGYTMWSIEYTVGVFANHFPEPKEFEYAVLQRLVPNAYGVL